jgi:hypothetical protein
LRDDPLEIGTVGLQQGAEALPRAHARKGSTRGDDGPVVSHP